MTTPGLKQIMKTGCLKIDQRIGYVKKVNKKDKFRPVIKILSPESKKGMTDLSKERKKIKILKSLNPLGEGKKYSDLMKSE